MSSGRLKMPIVLRGCNGVGGASATHHSGNYSPFIAHVPGWRVVVPTTPRDAKGLLKSALRSDDPVLFLEHKSLLNTKGSVPDPEADEVLPFGVASVRREGSDVSVVAIGLMVNKALEAAEHLAGEGIAVEMIDPRSIAPLDIDTILTSVHKTGRLLIVDEDFGPVGMGAEISAQVTERAFDDLDAPIRRVNGLHTPVPYSPPLEAVVVPNPEQIAAAIRSLVDE
jgi:2-oxoisovalerate dehydrogenase E1 component